LEVSEEKREKKAIKRTKRAICKIWKRRRTSRQDKRPEILHMISLIRVYDLILANFDTVFKSNYLPTIKNVTQE
jgi:hypothetical protein